MAQTPPWSDTVEVLVAVGVLIGVILLGTWLLLYLRARMRSEDEDDANRTPFTLHDLRRMHQAGHLSDAEFQTAKARIVAMFRREAETDDESATDEPMNHSGASDSHNPAGSDDEPPGDDPGSEPQKNPRSPDHNPPR